MGGLAPRYGASPRLHSPPRGGAWVCERQALLLTLRGKPKRATLRGCFRSNPPQMAPPNLGIARIRWEYSWSNRYRFSPIFSDFLGRIFLVIGRVSFTSTISLYDHCFFFRNRPLEESPHQSCRAFRGEVDSSIPRVFGGFRVVVFEA